MLHKDHKGFKRLRPGTQLAQGKSLMEQLKERGYTESPSDKPTPSPPTPPANPVDDLTEEEKKEIARRERMRRITGGK